MGGIGFCCLEAGPRTTAFAVLAGIGLDATRKHMFYTAAHGVRPDRRILLPA